MSGGAAEDFGFRRAYRLLRPAQFGRVLKSRRSVRSDGVQLLVGPGEGSGARLGLVVGKRFVRSAVLRNRFKRLARESFRHWRCTLPDVDLVVRVTSSMDNADFAALRQRLDSLFQRLVR